MNNDRPTSRKEAKERARAERIAKDKAADRISEGLDVNIDIQIEVARRSGFIQRLRQRHKAEKPLYDKLAQWSIDVVDETTDKLSDGLTYWEDGKWHDTN